MKNKILQPKIRLYHYAGLCLIVERPTGIIYSNQAGGCLCAQPELEGVLMPINDRVGSNRFIDAENVLFKYFTDDKYEGGGAWGGIDNQDADFIDGVAAKAFDSDWVMVDREKLNQSMEAWIWIICKPGLRDAGYIGVFKEFYAFPWHGVLTWENSD